MFIVSFIKNLPTVYLNNKQSVKVLKIYFKLKFVVPKQFHLQ